MNPKSAIGKGRVLLLTADAKEGAALQCVLEASGFHVVGICATPQKAPQIVQEMRPDLVMAAIFFDGEPYGIEMCRSIQEDLRIPVVYLGATEDPLLVLQIAMTQPAGYITDLKDAQYLKALVGRVLKGARPSGVAAPF